MKKISFLLGIVITIIITSCNNQPSDNSKSNEMKHDEMEMKDMKMDSAKMDSTMHNSHQQIDSMDKK